MASESWPNSAHNSGAVSTTEWEQLAYTGLGTGVIGLPTDTPVVYADGTGTRTVYVRAEKRAVVRGAAWYSGASDIAITLSANTTGSTCTDLIVLRLTKATGVVAEAIVPGTPGAGPPALTKDAGTTGVWEVGLAQVTVADGATTLAADTVTSTAWYVGDQPLVAASGISIPHHPTRIKAVPAGRIDISDGSVWHPLWYDTGWLSATMSSGWAVDAYSNAKYRRINDVMHIIFGAKRTGSSLSASTNSVMGSIPSSLAPAYTIRMPVSLNTSTQAVGVGVLNSDGAFSLAEYSVTLPSGRWVYFPPITYPI